MYVCIYIYIYLYLYAYVRANLRTANHMPCFITLLFHYYTVFICSSLMEKPEVQ